MSEGPQFDKPDRCCLIVVVMSALACLQGGFSPTKGAGDLVEGEGVDQDPLQLRCVLEIANTGGYS